MTGAATKNCAQGQSARPTTRRSLMSGSKGSAPASEHRRGLREFRARKKRRKRGRQPKNRGHDEQALYTRTPRRRPSKSGALGPSNNDEDQAEAATSKVTPRDVYPRVDPTA